METFSSLLKRSRTFRRFHQDFRLEPQILEEIVGLTRYCPSPANLQPLKYICVTDEEMANRVFEQLKWAAYLKDWPGPAEGERPSAYIIFIGDRRRSPFIDWDYGIALQAMILGSNERELGTCAFAAFDKERIREIFSVEAELEIPLVLAIGKPREEVVVDDMTDDDVQYYRDANSTHHVPKRTVEDLILETYS